MHGPVMYSLEHLEIIVVESLCNFQLNLTRQSEEVEGRAQPIHEKLDELVGPLEEASTLLVVTVLVDERTYA